jgi:hypothetical protein
MALRDQPYLPLYVQDFMTDEKLAECSASATGVYIRLMCVMHKSEHYGKIILKQKDKICHSKNDGNIQNFAYKISKFLPYNLQEIEKSLSELIEENVLQIDGDVLFQKRMVNDNELSTKRSLSGSKGGLRRWDSDICHSKNDGKNKKDAMAKPIANTEDECEDENEVVNKDDLNTQGVIGGCGEGEEKPCDYEVLDELSFDNVWAMYGKKGNKKTSMQKWGKLKNHCKLAALKHIPDYVSATPDIQYRKNFETYINQEAWNDKIITKNGTENRFASAENANSMGNGNSGNGANTFRTDAEKRRNERSVLVQVAETVLQQPKT